METIKNLLLQTSSGAGPTIGGQPDYADVLLGKTMKDPFGGCPALGDVGPILSPVPMRVGSNETAPGGGEDCRRMERPQPLGPAVGSEDFIHPRLSELKQPPVIVGVAVKRSLRKPPEVITRVAGGGIPLEASTLERWHKDIFEAPPASVRPPLQYDDDNEDECEDGVNVITEVSNKTFEKYQNRSCSGDDKSCPDGLGAGGQTLALNGVEQDGANGDAENGHDLIDLIDFSSDLEQEFPAGGAEEKAVAPLVKAVVEVKKKRVTFLLDPFQHDDTTDGGEESDVTEEDSPPGEDVGNGGLSGSEDAGADIDTAEKRWVDESDPIDGGRSGAKVSHQASSTHCQLRNEISTETRQTDDIVLRTDRGVAGKSSGGHVDSEAARWSPQRILEENPTEALDERRQETETIQRACSSPLHGESESLHRRHHHHHQNHHHRQQFPHRRWQQEGPFTITDTACGRRSSSSTVLSAHSDGGGVYAREIDETLALHGERAVDVCLPNACAGTESINDSERQRNHHQSVKGQQTVIVGSGGSGGKQSSTVQAEELSASIDGRRRYQHRGTTGSDIEGCCIDGRDWHGLSQEQQVGGKGDHHREVQSSEQQWQTAAVVPLEEHGRIDERASYDEQHRVAVAESTDDDGSSSGSSLLRGLECVSTRTTSTALVGPIKEDKPEESLGWQEGCQWEALPRRQQPKTAVVARTAQTCPAESEEKSTQVPSPRQQQRPAAGRAPALSSDSESENYYGTCSPPTVVRSECTGDRCKCRAHRRNCPYSNNGAGSSLLVEVTLNAHICVHQQNGNQAEPCVPDDDDDDDDSTVSFTRYDGGVTTRVCQCENSSGQGPRVLRDSATNTQGAKEENRCGGSADDSDTPSTVTSESYVRPKAPRNPSSADSGILIIDDDDEEEEDDDVEGCEREQEERDEQSACNPPSVPLEGSVRAEVNEQPRSIVKGPVADRDTQTFIGNFIDSEKRSPEFASTPDGGGSEVLAAPAQHPVDAEIGDAVTTGGVECFEASQRLKRLEERFRGLAYTKKLFRPESGVRGTPGGSLPSLLVCAGHPAAPAVAAPTAAAFSTDGWTSVDYANTNTFAADSPTNARRRGGRAGAGDANVTLCSGSPTQSRRARGLRPSTSTPSLLDASSSSAASSPSSATVSLRVAAGTAAASEASRGSALLPSRKTSSLSCLQQDATQHEDETECHLLSTSRTSRRTDGDTRGATNRPARRSISSWTRPILPPLSSSLLSLSASSLLSLSCLDLERQGRQRAGSQPPPSNERLVATHGIESKERAQYQDTNNNKRVDEIGLSKAVSLPSLLSQEYHGQIETEYLPFGVDGLADREREFDSGPCVVAVETLRPDCDRAKGEAPESGRAAVLGFTAVQRHPRAVEELRQNTDTPESSGAESEEICKIFPGGRARVGDPLEVVETVVLVNGSTEDEDDEDDVDEEEEQEEEEEEEEELLSSDAGCAGEGEVICVGRVGQRDDPEEEFVQLEKLLAADPHTNCEFDTRHLQDYEPEVYRIKYCYDELEEELEEQQQQQLFVVVGRGERSLPVPGPPPAVPPPPPPPPPKAGRAFSSAGRVFRVVPESYGDAERVVSKECGVKRVSAGTEVSQGCVGSVPTGGGLVLLGSSTIHGENGHGKGAPSKVVLVTTGGVGGVQCGEPRDTVSAVREDGDIPPPPPPPKARAGSASVGGCGCVLEAIPLYRSAADALVGAGGGEAMRETAGGTLRGLLKKPNRPPPVRKNRVVFDETRNEFFEADYIILIREDCPYDEEDEEPCTCGEHELVRICCDEGCNCGYTDDGRTPPEREEAQKTGQGSVDGENESTRGEKAACAAFCPRTQAHKSTPRHEERGTVGKSSESLNTTNVGFSCLDNRCVRASNQAPSNTYTTVERGVLVFDIIDNDIVELCAQNVICLMSSLLASSVDQFQGHVAGRT
uniref:Uncharacterized protein n=1 Tax=Anopheles atroparvus TaxID=41427 RepID=A0A182JGB3_ANOAO